MPLPDDLKLQNEVLRQAAQGYYSMLPERQDPLVEIRSLGLEKNVLELEANGYTVVDPERVAPPGFAERLRTAILSVMERRGLPPPKAEVPESELMTVGPNAHALHYMLLEDRVFEEALMNPVALALITYLLGPNCVLSSSIAIVKGPSPMPVPLHHDTAYVPPPMPQYPLIVNATYALTDYTRANGALCFVPGSHRLGTAPPYEAVVDQERHVPVETPAGSLIVWPGNTWHGAFARQAPGLRVSLALYCSRMFMRTQEEYRTAVSEEILARNPPRFAKLMGKHIMYGWKAEGPNPRVEDRSIFRTIYDWHA
jgi:hypothetical protein